MIRDDVVLRSVLFLKLWSFIFYTHHVISYEKSYRCSGFIALLPVSSFMNHFAAKHGRQVHDPRAHIVQQIQSGRKRDHGGHKGVAEAWWRRGQGSSTTTLFGGGRCSSALIADHSTSMGSHRDGELLLLFQEISGSFFFLGKAKTTPPSHVSRSVRPGVY